MLSMFNGVKCMGVHLYLPSHKPDKGSRIRMFIFRTSDGGGIKPVELQDLGQALVSL